MFTPNPIANEQFVLSGRTLAELSRAEVELVRGESALLASDRGTALLKNIARLEAVATIRIDGRESSLEGLLKLEGLWEMACVDNTENSLTTTRFLQGQEAVDEASADALKYLEVLQNIASTVDESHQFTPQFLVDLHSFCMKGTSAAASGVRFRQRPYAAARSGLASEVYQPPRPEKVPELVDDLCTFMNKDVYSPIAQAALAHFQFEGIKPFKSGLDRTGRAMCHAIMFRRGLFRGAIVPIALMPAIDTYAHASHLLPYDMGRDIKGKARACSLDDWVWFCARSTSVAASTIRVFMDAFASLEACWHERVGRVSKGSTIEELLFVLLGNPVVSVAHAACLLDKSISATNDALNRLVQYGVVRCDEEPGARNRIFVADEVLRALGDMEHFIIRQGPIAREEAVREVASSAAERCARCGLCDFPQ